MESVYKHNLEELLSWLTGLYNWFVAIGGSFVLSLLLVNFMQNFIRWLFEKKSWVDTKVIKKWLLSLTTAFIQQYLQLIILVNNFFFWNSKFMTKYRNLVNGHIRKILRLKVQFTIKNVIFSINVLLKKFNRHLIIFDNFPHRWQIQWTKHHATRI